MKKASILFLGGIVLLFSAYTLIQSSNWNLKEDTYTIKFSGKKVDGQFKGLKTSIVFDPAHPEKSKLSATVEVSTINTGNGMKDTHAKSETAFDAGAFPTIKFESTSVSQKNGKYEAVGNLTIKGISKPLTIPFSFDSKGSESVFTGKFMVSPKAFNMTRNGLPDSVEVDLNIPVTKAP
jgi:polyisoprenoid-binding protein YceI